MKITIEEKQYELNVENAMKSGCLREVVEFCPGNVYSPSGENNLHCNVVLVRAIWNVERGYQLLGLQDGFAPNSDLFFNELHTRQEILEYLKKKNLVFSHKAGNVLRK